VSIKFSKELKLREWVSIETKLLNYSGKIGEIEQRIIKESGVVATRALFKFGLFDLEARRLIELDEGWKKAFS
jgi:acyl-CoA thioester hydrolase